MLHYLHIPQLDKLLDLPSESQQRSLASLGARLTMVQDPKIVSVKLSVNAYKKSVNKIEQSTVNLFPTKLSGDMPNWGRKEREIKVTVLRSLQSKSNSGMVNMRDVAFALDHLLSRNGNFKA